MRTDPTVTLLGSGYWIVWWGPQCWAQWPRGQEPTDSDVFDPAWNWPRFQAWYEVNRDRFVGAGEAEGADYDRDGQLIGVKVTGVPSTREAE